MAKRNQTQSDPEAAAHAEAERKAREARAARNQAQTDRRNAIADNADAERQRTEPFEEVEDLEHDPDPAGDPQEHENEVGDEAVIAQAQADEDSNDTARAAGAEDARKRADGVTEYLLVVNGKEKWQTLSEIRATAQKVQSADEYLQQAADSVRRTAKESSDADGSQEAQQAEVEAKARRERLKDLQRRSALGDEEAIDELAQVLDGLSRVTPDVRKTVTEIVDARVAGTNAFQSAVTWFEGEYKDELASPRLKAMAGRLDRDFAQAEPALNPRDRLKKVGEELRAIRKELGGGRSNPSDKVRRKETVETLPTASGRRVEIEEGEETETAQQTIRRMAQARQGRTVTK